MTVTENAQLASRRGTAARIIREKIVYDRGWKGPPLLTMVNAIIKGIEGESRLQKVEVLEQVARELPIGSSLQDFESLCTRISANSEKAKT